MGLFSRPKKAYKADHVHEPQPCVLLKYTPFTAENRPHPLDETPGGAEEMVDRTKEAGSLEKKKFWRSFLHLFRRRAGKYDLAQAEKVNQMGANRRFTDDQTPLQHIPIVEIHDHQEASAAEVFPALEKQLEQDVLQPQDIHAPVNLTEEGKVEELDKDQPSLWHIVEIQDLQEAPVSEVLITAEEQLEQDVLQPQDVDVPVSSSEDDKAEELDKDQTSLQQIVEIQDLGEALVSEVLPSAEEQLEQDVLQPQDVHTPVSLTEEDKVEELNKDQTSLQRIVEIQDLGEALVSEVLPSAEEQLEQDVLQPQNVHTPVSSTEDDEDDDDDDKPDNSHIFWQYEFGPKLGEEGYGCVYAGTRCKDGLKVAVKIVEKTPDMSYIRVPGHPKRLPMEIGMTLMANKGPSVPQIIKLLDWQDDPDHYVVVLERPMPSMSMFSFVKLQGKLNEGMAQHFIWQVILAANICCERGVFHRYIKLENLLVNTDTLEVKLINFGCGTLMKDSAYMAFNGTDMFCPPEFDVDGRYYAKPATVWSLGILLFVMVCGYYPDDKHLHMISKNDWSDPDLSQECCQMICSCLHPDPQRRLILEEMQLHDWFMVLRLES